jgi:uncharacterized protein (DUF2141 family)
MAVQRIFSGRSGFRAVLSTLALLYSSAGSADQLVVDITGIEDVGGHMMVAVYADAETWSDNGAPVATARDSVTGPLVRVIFQDLPSGTYAVKLYHDRDNNGELDTNMLGIPVEDYGFSNNASGLGGPDFDEAAFELSGEASISIELR